MGPATPYGSFLSRYERPLDSVVSGFLLAWTCLFDLAQAVTNAPDDHYGAFLYQPVATYTPRVSRQYINRAPSLQSTARHTRKADHERTLPHPFTLRTSLSEADDRIKQSYQSENIALVLN